MVEQVLFSECFVVVLLFCPVFCVFLVSVVVQFVKKKQKRKFLDVPNVVVACASHSQPSSM